MKIYKNKFFIVCLILILLALGSYFIFSKKPKTEYVTAKVSRGGLIQTVSETGTVIITATNQKNLLFSALPPVL